MFTEAETKILTEACKHKLSLISGKLTDPLSRERKEDAWHEILTAVNFLGGGYTKDQVNKRLANIRSKALGTVRDFNRKSRLTGGGPPITMPSEETLLFVSDVIEKTKIDGIEGALDDIILLTTEPSPTFSIPLTSTISDNPEIKLPQKVTKRKTRTEECTYEMERKRLSLQMEVLKLQKEHYQTQKEHSEMQKEQYKQQKDVMSLLNDLLVNMRDKYHIESQKLAMENFMLKSKLASENITFIES